MRATVWVAFLQLAETLVRSVVGLLLGFLGFLAVLSAFFQMGNVHFRFFSGSGVVLIASVTVGGLLLWFAGKILNTLGKPGHSA